jgi:hypothetical protein
MENSVNLTDRKIEAKIAELMAETSRINARINVEGPKLQAELMKIIEETKKISAERQWYPIASAGVGAIIASLIVAASKLWF